jgi:hypothetical protein
MAVPAERRRALMILLLVVVLGALGWNYFAGGGAPAK